MWSFVLLSLWLLLIVCLHKLNKNYYVLLLCKRIRTEDGSDLKDKVAIIPGILPGFGNNLDLLKLTPETLFHYARNCQQLAKDKSGFALYFLRHPVYNITTAEDAAELFQSTTVITKSVLYGLAKPFLGDGLLISSGHKWQYRRKILTPAFHFNVLESFIEVFKEESIKLLGKLENCQKEVVDVNELITHFTLNNVIETALGVKLDDMTTEYRKVVHDLEATMIERLSNPIFTYDIIFRLFGNYRKHQRDLKIAHNFSSEIIERKRKEYQQNQQQHIKEKDIDNGANNFGQKKRYAMLDTLLVEEAKGNIDHQGICDEVNTFMFEGSDTTSTCLIFAILNLALHPQVQKKCREEIADMEDFSSFTVFDFNRLHYLECVLKEVLRMYPAVPFIARTCAVETHLNGLILPQQTQICIHIFDIMRDPKHFTEPDTFKPERFLPENSHDRHPFAFVGFSAGSRNCIGQKFAILEMKAVLVAILKNFEILPVTKFEDLILEYGIVLRTQRKVYVKLKKL